MSDGSDERYGHNQKCKWIIVAPPNSLIELSFKSFELEHMDHCQYADYLKIYDGIVSDQDENNDDAVKPIGTYCGSNKPPTMLSTSHAFTLVFRSDDTINGEGFEASYEFIDVQNCEYNQAAQLEWTSIKQLRRNFQFAEANFTHRLEQLWVIWFVLEVIYWYSMLFHLFVRLRQVIRNFIQSTKNAWVFNMFSPYVDFSST